MVYRWYVECTTLEPEHYLLHMSTEIYLPVRLSTSERNPSSAVSLWQKEMFTSTNGKTHFFLDPWDTLGGDPAYIFECMSPPFPKLVMGVSSTSTFFSTQCATIDVYVNRSPISYSPLVFDESLHRYREWFVSVCYMVPLNNWVIYLLTKYYWSWTIYFNLTTCTM